MRYTLAITLIALLVTLSLAQDIFCDESTACEVGCCGSNNVCGTGPNYCSKKKCINSCDYKAECNPGDWSSQYYNSTKCPLNVCCSKFGFCGTTEEFCGKETVKRPSCSISSQSVDRVIGYYGSGGASRSCNSMPPMRFPQGIYTHIYFAFGSIDPDTFEVIPATAGDERLYSELASLKARDVGQELWLSIGGWVFSDTGTPTATTFSDLVNASEKRQNDFFSSLTLFMHTWGFTGVDIDWEYPVDIDRNGRPSDFKSYPKFLKRLRSALHDYKFGLSVTLPTSYWYLQHFDLENIAPSVDWFNFMSYDLHGAWDIGNKWTGAHVGAHTNLTEIESSLDLLWRNKVPSYKVVLGLAFYGRAVTLADPSCSEPGCPYVSAGDAGKCSGEAGILFNSEITDLIHEKKLRPKLHRDAAVKTIQWNNDQWVSYDDKDTWKLKANFLKSQCLSGILVWAVDYDDNEHSYSKGLAAAFGIKDNFDDDTGLTIVKPEKSVKDDPKDFCYFTNCGQTCPKGYTEIVRDDKKSQIMLDSTQCPPGTGQTQTLCCPKSSKIPTCRWRDHNGGKCIGGCNDGEIEVGTTGAACRSGYQSACCTDSESAKPWKQCQWTGNCFSDKTCPKGYSEFIVGSGNGFGGRPSCKSGSTYNYCCSDTPKAFKNCEWYGHEVEYTNDRYCTDTCPHGSTRIAEQSLISWLGGAGNTPHVKGCGLGQEAYCCAGQASEEDDRPTIVYRDATIEEFQHYLRRFLSNPVCPAEWEAQFSSDGGLYVRDNKGISTEMTAVLSAFFPLVKVWLTSQRRRSDFGDAWHEELQHANLTNVAADETTFDNLEYGAAGDVNQGPSYDEDVVISEMLCNIASSRAAMEQMATAADGLCTIGDDLPSKRHVLKSRKLTAGTTDDRSDDGSQPSIAAVFAGIRGMELTLHYLRWIPPSRTRPDEIILEAAFWIGEGFSAAPDQNLRARYSDITHTLHQDRWIVMHFHVPLDTRTFQGRGDRWFLGVHSMGIYHSQTVHNPGPVDRQSSRADDRAEFRFSPSYPSRNNPPMTNYNARTQPLSCRGPNQRFYLGQNYGSRLGVLRTSDGQEPRYAREVNSFGIWFAAQGVFSRQNLAMIWPDINTSGVNPVGFDANANYDPVPGAFDVNWLPDGSPVFSLQAAFNL